MANAHARSGKTSPPAGTGHAPGLGEAFDINLNTGQGMYAYTLPLPDGVAGHTPKVRLEYSHGAGHGAFGLGWRLPLRGIAYRLDHGVPDDEAGTRSVERLMDSGAEIAPAADGSYRALVETGFTRYRRSGAGWLIEERNGTVHEAGLEPAARIAMPGRPDRVREWLVQRTLDACDNAIGFAYLIDEGMPYLAEIRYAAYAVRFEHEDRPDVRSDGRMGFLRRRAKRCARIVLLLDPGPHERRLRTWSLVYDTESANGASLLASIQMTSHGAAADGSDDVARAAVGFTYTGFDPADHRVGWIEATDGPHPPPLTEPDVALVGLDRAPLPGVLQVVNGRQVYWGNEGGTRWRAPRPVARAPGIGSLADAGVVLADMDASGTADLMVQGNRALHGYYENGGETGWARFVAYPRGRSAAPPWSSSRMRLTDADGDGLIDAMTSGARAFALWRNWGEQGWAEPLVAPIGDDPSGPDVDFSDPLVRLADMTGDGLDDLVRIRSGRIDYWPGLGNGRFGARVSLRHSPRLPDASRNPQGTVLLDVDGDGCADLVRVGADGVEVYLNRNGASFADPVRLDAVPTPIPGTIRPANMTGRIGTGLLWNSLRGRQVAYVRLEFSPASLPYLLARIDNGCGLASEIRYRSAVEDFQRDRDAGTPWGTHFPFPYLVVAGTREVDQVSGQVTEVAYRYSEAHFDHRARRFQGFGRSERIDKGDDSRADTRTVFHFLMAQERLPGNGPEHAALNGLMRRTEVFGLDGTPQQHRPYRIEQADHALELLDTLPDGRRRVFVRVTAHRSEDIERGDDLRGEEKTYAYDAFGNVVQERLRGYGLRGGVVQPERIRVTQVAYAAGTRRWLIDKPSRSVTRDADGTILMEKRCHYDGPDFSGLPLGQVARGLLMREEQLAMPRAAFDAHYAGMDAAALGYGAADDADEQPAMFATTRRHAYDARGLKVADRDPLGSDTVYAYDPHGLLRTRLTDAQGTTTFVYDRSVGQPTQVTYADGTQVRYAYDAQGRVRWAVLPGDAADDPPIVFTYDDAAVPNARIARLRQSGAAGDTSMAVTYFDGRGKEIQQRVETDDARFVVSATSVRNPWGDVKREYEPTFSESAAFSLPIDAGRASRAMHYDGRGRVTRTVNYNGGTSTAAYLPFEVITRDANDHDDSADNRARGQFDTPRRETFDVLRHQVSIVDELGDGAAATTSYRTDVLGQLLEVRDTHGTLCRYRYDRMGNRIEIDHREAGRRTLWYDARRKTVRTLDAAGNDLRAVLDARGRLVRLSAGATVLEEYVYDDPAHRALGRLAQVTYPGGRQSFHYDAAGRLARHEHHFEGQAAPHALAYEYDVLGREVAVTHPDGTRIARRLTRNGWVKALPGYLTSVAHDARGLPVRLAFANGVVTETAYSPGPGRTLVQKTVNASGQVLEDIRYGYDKMDVLLGSVEAAPGVAGTREYRYDPLYQITHATHAAAGGAPPTTRRYDYVGHHDLSRFEEAGSTLHYDDATHPMRVAGLTADGGARLDLGYDANGNLLALPGRTLHYNAKNELDRLERADGLTAHYRYDHRGVRVAKTVDDHGLVARTFFVDRFVEIRNGQPTHFVWLGHLRVAIVTQGATRFVHGDPLGGTAFFTDAAGVRIAAVAYRPFGNVESSSGAIDARTFGVHPFDTESGLYYMRRRYYAPELGRFVTPDPIAVYRPTSCRHDPKALHPYLYVANDPLNKSDLSGLSFWSVVGAVVGVIAAVAIAAAVVMTGGLAGVLLGVALAIGVTAVSYVVADATAGTGFGEFMRGFMIGMNAGLNAIIATALFGPVVGIALGVINFLAAFDTIANSAVYQGILGWSSWLMPMSWLATGVGLVFFLLNVIPAIVTLNQVDAVRIDSLSVDWKTGTIIMEGGWMFLPGFRGGYDLGNFAYITPGSSVTEHEIGHSLSNAAFGSIFHYVGAIDENAIRSNPADAYAERIAESHDSSTVDPDVIPMWV